MPKKKTLVKLSDIEKISAMQATKAEAASFFRISVSTFNKLLDKDPRAREAWERGKDNGKLTLRRKQMRLASTNAQMAIFLGKQYLDQDDKTVSEITGKDGGPLEVADLTRLSIDERKKLKELLLRAKD